MSNKRISPSLETILHFLHDKEAMRILHRLFSLGNTLDQVIAFFHFSTPNSINTTLCCYTETHIKMAYGILINKGPFSYRELARVAKDPGNIKAFYIKLAADHAIANLSPLEKETDYRARYLH